MRRDTAKARAFQQRGRESSALSLQESSRQAARNGAAERSEKPEPPFNIFAANCELRRYDPEHRACSGLVMRCHLIKEQWLENELKLDIIDRWSEDWWLRGCERHHHLLDHGFIVLERRELPPRLERRAMLDERVAAKLEREYGPLPKIGAAA